ncbi:MAG: hypothetical protein R2698_02570 [Microthrixaceae bacterium]
MSSWLLLFGLAVAWAVVLVPDLLRRSAASRRSDTIAQFSRNLSSLGRTHSGGSLPGPGPLRRDNVVALPSRPAALGRAAGPRSGGIRSSASRRNQQRRQEILTGLAAAALLTFLGSVSIGGVITVLHVLVDLALVSYLGAVMAVTRREKVQLCAPVRHARGHRDGYAVASSPAHRGYGSAARSAIPAYAPARSVAR